MTAKNSIDDLAIFGGSATFPQMLHVGRPNIGDREQFLRRTESVLDSRWLTNRGPLVREFEEKIAQYIGVKHCIAMCNGTVALEIAIRAAGLKGEVIVPAFTFVATVHALKWQEITPVFCDINRDDYTIDIDQVADLITPRTTGIVGVHVWGRPCDVEGLEQIARQHRLAVIYDSAHAFGCTYGGARIGQFGDAEVFSFHATKIINTFEGGAVVTNNDELADRIRLMQNFGFSDYDQVSYIGTNGKMTEISAAMGTTMLEQIDWFMSRNAENYFRYRDCLGDIPGIRLLGFDADETSNFHYVTLLVEESDAGYSRDELAAVLKAENVFARRYFYPGCHRMEPYRTLYPEAGARLGNTDYLCARALCLPTGSSINQPDIERICGVIRFVSENATGIQQKLRKEC